MNRKAKKKTITQVNSERFELTWDMVQQLSLVNDIYVRSNASEISFALAWSKGKMIEAANALEIILQCKTFSPGVFQRIDGKWQRM